MQGRSRRHDLWLGVMLGASIICLWGVSLVQLLRLSLDGWPMWSVAGAVLGRTFLHTGLFIVAHDSMHLSLAPHHPRLNTALGTIAVWLYAFLPYERCRTNHLNHHRFPAQHCDPDFHGGREHPVRWYLKFIQAYLPIRDLVRFVLNCGALFVTFRVLFHVQPVTFLLVWLLPLVLSSIQLFVFGTYLPHRETPNKTAKDDANRSTIHSLPFPFWWSFLTCYHFGYHWEHHTYPTLPWYRLPAAHQDCKQVS